MISALLVAVAAAAASPAAAPAAPDTARIQLIVAGFEPGRGPILAALFDSEAGWRAGRPVRNAAAPADGAEASLGFDALPPGRYAVRLFHDLDGDGRLAANAFGVPTEPFAFSNGAAARFGAPAWDEAAFAAGPGETRHRISLR